MTVATQPITDEELDALRLLARSGDRDAELTVQAGHVADLIAELDALRAVVHAINTRSAESPSAIYAYRLALHDALALIHKRDEQIARTLADVAIASHRVGAESTGDARRDAIVSLAIQIGQHWRDQDGVNGALLDELARLVP